MWGHDNGAVDFRAGTDLFCAKTFTAGQALTWDFKHDHSSAVLSEAYISVTELADAGSSL